MKYRWSHYMHNVKQPDYDGDVEADDPEGAAELVAELAERDGDYSDEHEVWIEVDGKPIQFVVYVDVSRTYQATKS